MQRLVLDHEFANSYSEFEPVPALRAIQFFPCMVEPGQAELCEHCGSPLDESGLCWSCGGAGGFQGGGSPVGAAPLEQAELAKIFGKGVGKKALGLYSLSMQQAEGMSHLRGEIESLTEQFNASPQLKNSVRQNSERNAIKLLPELGPTKAAIASVAQEFLSLGRSMTEVSYCIARVHQRVGRLSSLVLEVYSPEVGNPVGVLVNSREREFKCYAKGLYRTLRITVYCWDDGAVVELRNAFLCEDAYPTKRMRVLGPSTFALVLAERTFQLFKILKQAKHSDVVHAGGPALLDPVSVVKKYSIARLHFTERFLRETGYLNRVSARYNVILQQKLLNGNGRMPRKLAEEALTEACNIEVPPLVSDLVVKRYVLKPSEMSSLIALPEFEAWQRMGPVS